MSGPAVSLGIDEGGGASVDRFARTLSDGLRQTLRRTASTTHLAAKAWAHYAKRGARWLFLALLVAVLDRNLLAAWRSTGLQVLTTYVPLMLYVNLRLFFDRRVRWLGKALLLGAIGYGVWRHDLLPDRSPVPGFIDDVLLVIVFTRLFLSWATDDVVFEHASEAVKRWGHLAMPPRLRQR